MSYETVSEIREKNLTGILTDISNIEYHSDLESVRCFDLFTSIILNDLWFLNLDCWIAGGSLRDFFMNRKSESDIDIYFSNAQDNKKAESHLIKNGGKIIFSNSNCTKISFDKYVFDLIKIYYIDHKVCISNFDFTVCSCSISKIGLSCHKSFKSHIKSMTLELLNPNQQTIDFRLDKYQKIGFKYES